MTDDASTKTLRDSGLLAALEFAAELAV